MKKTYEKLKIDVVRFADNYGDTIVASTNNTQNYYDDEYLDDEGLGEGNTNTPKSGTNSKSNIFPFSLF